jgi:hypothetical protein
MPNNPRLKAPVFQADDFTTFVKIDSKSTTKPEFQFVVDALRDADGKFKKRYEGSLTLASTDESGNPVEASGRSLVCSCYDGRHLSVTLRITNHGFSRSAPIPKPGKKEILDATVLDKLKEKEKARKRRFDCSEYVSPPWQSDEPTEAYPLAIGWLNDAIFDLFPPLQGERWSGAVLITGETGSGKTQVACGLIHKYLGALRLEGGRRPHFVTVEYPIEKWLTHFPETAQGWGIDYTPRIIGTDVATLRDGLSDALRQKPAIVYLGELRSDAELKDLIWFAGTGHLVVATAHAGSLVQSMDKILLSQEADTAARRQQTAQSLCAVVHLNSGSTVSGSKFVLPAIWKCTGAGLDTLVADGLASLLPNTPPDDCRHDCSSIGRYYFANRLLGRLKRKKPMLYNTVQAEIIRASLDWDLKGM